MFEFIDVYSLFKSFFFTPVNMVPFNLYRQVISIVALFQLAIHLKNYQSLYGLQSIYPFSESKKTKNKYFSIFFYIPEKDFFHRLVFISGCIASLTLFFGLFISFSSTILWVIFLSIYNRNRYIGNAGDTILRFVLFFMIFSPDNPSEINIPWAFRLMQILVAIVYLKNVYWKLKGYMWRQGNAVYHALSCNHYQKIDITNTLLHNKLFYRFATYFTLISEFSMGALVWFDECRLIILLSIFLLHLGIFIFMYIELFEIIMIANLILFLKPEEIQLFFDITSRLINNISSII